MRDDNRTDEELTNLLKNVCPSQIPAHFKIVPLPVEISSYLISALQRLPVKTQLQEKHTRTKIGRGPDGKNTVNPSDLKTTSSSTASQDQAGSDSLERLPWLCAKGVSHVDLMLPWLRAQSEVPSHLYLRPSGKMTVQTQQKTRTATLEEFYLDSSRPSATKIPAQSNKRPSPPKY